MIYKTLLALIVVFLFLALQSNGKNKNETIFENNLDTIPNSKIKYKGDLSNNEKSYILTRDRMRRYFEKHKFKSWDDAIYKRQEDSVKELDRKLKYALTDVPLLKKMPKSYWEINNTNLYDEPLTSYDMLDGLRNWKTFDDSMPLFYTSNNLLYLYFKKDNITSLENLTPKKLEKIINATFCIDWTFTNFISYKLPSDSNTNAYAILGVGAQDYPFAPPNMLYIFISKDGYTYIKEKEIRKNPLKEIPACEKLKDSADAIERKYSSDMKLQDKYINRVVRKYCNCYLESLKYSKQYPRIQKLIDETYRDLQMRIE